MIDSARELFLAQGYAPTTMGQIAAGAGVAVQTVYYTFRTKGGLLREVVEVTAAGAELPVPVTQRAWWQEMVRTTSPQRVLALAVDHGTAIYDRVAPLWPTVAAASATDPHVAEYWQGVSTDRRAGQRAMVGRLAELGGLAPDLPVDRATDIVVLLVGHDVYRGLVVDAGWPVREYRAWLFATLTHQLLGQEPDPDATRGCSFAAL